VKEIFEAAVRKPGDDEERKKGEQNRADLRARVDAGYYGYNLDEDDGTLLAYEDGKEKEAFERLLLVSGGEGETRDATWEPLPGDCGDGVPWVLPTAEEVEAELLERRKRKLLDQL
jgi:pre-mRNA-splicing factor ISY1